MNIYELPWTILSTHLAGVVTVTEEEIITAMKLVSDVQSLYGYWNTYTIYNCWDAKF